MPCKTNHRLGSHGKDAGGLIEPSSLLLIKPSQQFTGPRLIQPGHPFQNLVYFAHAMTITLASLMGKGPEGKTFPGISLSLALHS
jgi:hypothetical protein